MPKILKVPKVKRQRRINKKELDKKYQALFLSGVELQGVEPWSKQAAKLLSTCLSFYWFSNWCRKKAIQHQSYPLYFTFAPKPYKSYPDIYYAPYETPSGEAFRGTASCLILN